MVRIAKATESEAASVVCDMNSPSSKWLTTLRVNFSKEVRRPCSVSAGCCFGRGKQGECLGQVRVLTGGGRRGGAVSEQKKKGQALQKWGPGTTWELNLSGVSGRPAGGAVSKWERAERPALTEAAVICWKAPYYTVTAKWLFSCLLSLKMYTSNLQKVIKIT